MLLHGVVAMLLLAAQGKAPQKEAFLGVTTREPSKAEVDEFSLPKGKRIQGQVVESADPGGPAAKAGLVKGDVILKVNESRIHSRDSLEDAVRVAQPGSEAKLLIKRAGTKKEEEIKVALGERGGEERRIAWQYASFEQLAAAQAQAKREGKKVLVGLSGAETWWPTTRFESGSLSKTFEDERVISAFEAFVRVILRRPIAYEFADKFKGAPIPGVIVLDAEGAVRGQHDLKGDDAAVSLADFLKKAK